MQYIHIHARIMKPFLTRHAVAGTTAQALTTMSLQETMMASNKSSIVSAPTSNIDALVTQQFGRLTIIAIKRMTSGIHVWCTCACGKTWEGALWELTSGNRKACGCWYRKAKEGTGKDYIGSTFGKLTILRELPKHGNHRFVHCLCCCTQSIDVRLQHLKSGAIQSCGCIVTENGEAKRHSHIGERFGMLVVISEAWLERKDDHGSSCQATCLCDCGGTWTGYRHSLLSGATGHCGCLQYRTTPQRRRALDAVRRHKRRAHLKNLPHAFTAQQVDFMFQYWHYACAICRREEGFGVTIAFDHWIPLGHPECPGTIATNMLPLCHGRKAAWLASPTCNISKNDTDPFLWLTKKLSSRQAKKKWAEIQAYFAAAQAYAASQEDVA